MYRRVFLAVVVACAALYGLTELVLPPLAERQLRHSLEKTAVGVNVHVDAAPAVRLLFSHADHVSVRIRELRPDQGNGKLGDLLARTERSGTLVANVDHLWTHGLRLDDVALRKRGHVLSADAAVTRDAIARALPVHFALETRPESTRAFALTASVDVLGKTLQATARITATNGRLELGPDGQLARLIHLTLFQDPRISVDTVTSTSEGSRVVFSATGHLTT